MKRHPNRHAGFTLIELLVVVSIVALLLAILVPSLGRARRQARTAICLANLSQLGKALPIYADQYGGYLPQVYGGPVAWGEKRGALYRLIVASKILQETDAYPRLLVCSETRPRGAISYALNAVVFGYDNRDWLATLDGDPGGQTPDDPTDDLPDKFETPPLKLASIRNPSKVVTLYDVRPASLANVWHMQVNNDEADISDQFTAVGMQTSNHGPITQPNDAGFMWQKSLDDPAIEAQPPHGRAHNILFADTHAGTFSKWDPAKMTRLAGREPNDSKLR